MKISVLCSLALAAGTVGFVLPDQEVLAELEPRPNVYGLRKDAERVWHEAVDNGADVWHQAVKEFKSTTEQLADEIYGTAKHYGDAFSEAIDEGLEAWEEAEMDLLTGSEAYPPIPDEVLFEGDHEKSSLYDLIHKSKHTSKIAELVDEFDDLKELLQSADAHHTFFVPTNRAIEKIAHGDKGKKPSNEVMKAVLKYHLVPEVHTAKSLFALHTLPTLLEGTNLSEDPAETPQRLTVNLSPHGVRINRFSRIVYRNAIGSNGVLHAVDNILIPPPRMGALINLLPTEFGTFDLAFIKTGLYKEINIKPHNGATMFVPHNGAWRHLGLKVNAFLFSNFGKKYLKAVLKYHIVANQTMYSDHLYAGTSDDTNTAAIPKGRYHLDLPTLLGNAHLGVDVGRFGALINIHINHYTRVIVQDLIARDGAIQVVNRVLIPPHKKHGHHDDESEMSVAEFKERFEAFVDSADEHDCDHGEEPDWENLEL